MDLLRQVRDLLRERLVLLREVGIRLKQLEDLVGFRLRRSLEPAVALLDSIRVQRMYCGVPKNRAAFSASRPNASLPNAPCSSARRCSSSSAASATGLVDATRGVVLDLAIRSCASPRLLDGRFRVGPYAPSPVACRGAALSGGTRRFRSTVNPAACRNGRAISTARARFVAIQKHKAAMGSSTNAASTAAWAMSLAPREVEDVEQASQTSRVPGIAPGWHEPVAPTATKGRPCAQFECLEGHVSERVRPSRPS